MSTTVGKGHDFISTAAQDNGRPRWTVIAKIAADFGELLFAPDKLPVLSKNALDLALVEFCRGIASRWQSTGFKQRFTQFPIRFGGEQ